MSFISLSNQLFTFKLISRNILTWCSNNVYKGYKNTSPDQVDQPIIATALESISNLSDIIMEHKQFCSKCNLKFSEKYKRGHASVLAITWISVIVTFKIGHHLHIRNFQLTTEWLMCSGIIPNQYKRFMETSGIRCLPDTFFRDHFMPNFNLAICGYNESYTEALQMEIAASFVTRHTCR